MPGETPALWLHWAITPTDRSEGRLSARPDPVRGANRSRTTYLGNQPRVTAEIEPT